MKIVVELIFIAIILVCIWNGYKKGLVMVLGSILMIIISLFLGDLLSDTFAHEANPVIQPFVAGYMEGSEGVINESFVEVSGSESTVSMEDAIVLHPEYRQEIAKLSFMKMGIYENSAEKMAEQAVIHEEQNSLTLTAAIVDVMCGSATYFFGFILFFSITLILLTVLGNISNLSFKLPNMEKLNVIGGAVAGLIVAILFCSLAAWILKFSGALLPEEELGGIFGKLFVKMNLFSSFLSI